MILHYGEVLLLATLLFLMGAMCAVARRNMIMILIGVEVMLNAAGIALLAGALRWNALDGRVFVFFVMAFAAAEVAVGLALIVYVMRRTGSVQADTYRELKG
jgi:NADH-quinone oxidoreductase subunit K